MDKLSGVLIGFSIANGFGALLWLIGMQEGFAIIHGVISLMTALWAIYFKG